MDDSMVQRKQHRYFTILINLNPLDAYCGGTEVWIDQLKKGDLVSQCAENCSVTRTVSVWRGLCALMLQVCWSVPITLTRSQLWAVRCALCVRWIRPLDLLLPMPLMSSDPRAAGRRAGVPRLAAAPRSREQRLHAPLLLLRQLRLRGGRQHRRGRLTD